MTRPRSTPPDLDGYRYVAPLGAGGFADVFRYEQLATMRDVAVKVLLQGLGDEARRHFGDEARLMAKLSNHPSIVSIFAAGVAADGRPYLAMEMCRPEHLGTRIRQRPLSVAKALEVGIQVAGAVETAHRLGILHRDIKPANILFTEYGRPALTDFGISVSTTTGAGAAAFSPSWAPPEQVLDEPMGASGDVYALAATIWAMLTGHSPFVVPGGDNSRKAIRERVLKAPPPATGRVDVPDSLEQVLRTAMAKDPLRRYAAALDLARALQGVQAQLHQPVTTIEVREDAPADERVAVQPTGTVLAPLIDPDLARDASGAQTVFTGGPGVPSLSESAYEADLIRRGRGEGVAVTPLDFTGPSIPQVGAEPTAPRLSARLGPQPGGRRRWGRLLAPVAALVAVVVVVAVLAVLNGGRAATTATAAPTYVRPVHAVEPVSAPVDGRGVRDHDTVTFTWVNPDQQPGDTYLQRVVVPGTPTGFEATDTPTVVVPVQPGRTCLEVVVRRADGRSSDTATFCLDTP